MKIGIFCLLIVITACAPHGEHQPIVVSPPDVIVTEPVEETLPAPATCIDVSDCVVLKTRKHTFIRCKNDER